MVLLPDCSLATAEKVARRARAAVNALQIKTTSAKIKPAVSVGVGPVPVNAKTATEVLAVLSPALQRVKESGKNAVSF